jgi:hypothetical protein
VVECELPAVRVEVEELAVATQWMAIRTCRRASSSENPRRSRSRKNPSPRFPSLVELSEFPDCPYRGEDVVLAGPTIAEWRRSVHDTTLQLVA